MRYLFVVLLLAGCATHPVSPYGPDTYIVTSSDATLLGTRGKSEARTLRAANAHCAKIGKRMEVRESNPSGNAWTGTSGRLIFACV
jgi:hypothetical protein